MLSKYYDKLLKKTIYTCVFQLIPLIGFMALAATGATSASIYFLLTKPDVM